MCACLKKKREEGEGHEDEKEKDEGWIKDSQIKRPKHETSLKEKV